TTLTTGSVAGSNSVTATSGTLTGSPLTFTANTAAGAATKVAFTTQPSNVTAGIANSPSIVVTIQDGSNNTVTSSTATVTLAIGTNPGSATIGGTVSVAAVAGIATFNNVRLNKTGTGYTLAASSGTLAGATSNTFNVVAAPAVTIAIDSGSAQ